MTKKRLLISLLITVFLMNALLPVFTLTAQAEMTLPGSAWSGDSSGEIQACAEAEASSPTPPERASEDLAPEEPLQQPAVPEEHMFFYAEMIEDDKLPEIYGTLSYIPQNTQSISVLYSYNGSAFSLVEGREWDLTGFPEGDPFWTQLCIGADDYPLTVYDPEVDHLSIKLLITLVDGTTIWTEVSEILPDETVPMPQFTAQLVEDGQNPGIYGTLSYIPQNTTSIAVMYSFGGQSFDFAPEPLWDLSEGDIPLTQLSIGINEHPLVAYQSELVNSLYIKLFITREGEDISTEMVKFSHHKTYPLPDTPPLFVAKIELDSQGYYQVNGQFTDFPPNVARIRPLYSLDGEDYQPVSETLPYSWFLNDLGTVDAVKKFNLENQLCVMAYDEPLKSYRALKLDQFYVRLEITTEDGDTYHSQATLIQRGAPQPLPKDQSVRATIPFTMGVSQEGDAEVAPYGQYQITAREDATSEEVAALLPDQLPVEVQIHQKDTGKLLTSGIVNCQMTWKTLPPLTLTAGEALVLPDAANQLVVPAGAEIKTPLGVYTLPSSLTFDNNYQSDDIHLVINAISKDEKPDISLKENYHSGTLSLAFRQKPSGATAIKAYSFENEDSDQVEIGDLLDRRAINHNQAAALYGFVDILQLGDSPLNDYLTGALPKFSIGLTIEGGIFDGQQVILPWPGDYDPPTEIIEPDSSEGNENNAGSGGGNGDSSGNGGQRPDLPETPLPPVLEPSDDSDDQDPVVIPEVPQNPKPPAPAQPDETPAPVPPPDTVVAIVKEEGTLPPLGAESPRVFEQKIAQAAQKEPNSQNNPGVTPNNPVESPPPSPLSDEKIQAQRVAKVSVPNTPEQPAQPQKNDGIPLMGTALLLGLGLVAVTVAGSGGGSALLAKLLATVKKFFFRR